MDVIRPFPPKQHETDLYYDELDNFNKKIVLKHLKISGKINTWIEIRRYLIKQIQDEKCKQTLKRYKPLSILAEIYHKDYLMFNKFDNLSIYKCYLENTMIKEMTTNRMNYINIYYANVEKPNDFKYMEFNEEEWKLSKGQNMNDNDCQIMEKFKNGLLVFLNECVDLMKEKKIDGVKRCITNLNRKTKLMNRSNKDD